VKDRHNTIAWESKIKKILQDCPRVDLTVVYKSEYDNRFSIGWNNYFFIKIQRTGMLIKGADILKELNSYKLDFQEIYERISWYCERTRGIVVNKNHYTEDGINFWKDKMKCWIPSSISELLYLYGIFEPSKRYCLKTFFKLNRDFKNKINMGTASISELAVFLEELRNLCTKMKNNIWTRKGVAVILYKKFSSKNKFLLLQRQETMKGWEIVKGGLRKDEGLEHAAIRETIEETGLNSFKSIKILPHTFSFKMIKNSVLQENSYTLAMIEVLNGKLKLCNKLFKNARYFSKEEAMKKIIWPEYKKAVEVASQVI